MYVLAIVFVCSSCAHMNSPPAPFRENNITFVAQKEDFDTLVSGTSGYVIVCFTIKYCNSCIRFAPVFRKAAALLSGYDEIAFVTFNIFYDISSAQQYGVVGLPTTIILKDGEKIETIPGAVKEKELIQKIKVTLKTE